MCIQLLPVFFFWQLSRRCHKNSSTGCLKFTSKEYLVNTQWTISTLYRVLAISNIISTGYFQCFLGNKNLFFFFRTLLTLLRPFPHLRVIRSPHLTPTSFSLRACFSFQHTCCTDNISVFVKYIFVIYIFFFSSAVVFCKIAISYTSKAFSRVNSFKQTRRTCWRLEDSAAVGHSWPSTRPCRQGLRACVLCRDWLKREVEAEEAGGRCLCPAPLLRSLCARCPAAEGFGAARGGAGRVAAGAGGGAISPWHPSRWCRPPSRWHEVASALDEWLGGSSSSGKLKTNKIHIYIRQRKNTEYTFDT